MAIKKKPLNKQILDMIDRFTPTIRSAFLSAIGDITNEVTLAKVVEAINAGDVVAAFNALGFSDAAMRPLTAVVEQAFETGGVLAANSMPKSFTGGVKFRFDVRNSRAEAWLREHSSRLITAISDDTRIAIRNILDSGVTLGRNPRNIALDIVGRVGPTGRRTGGIIGLTGQQSGWVANARAELSDPATASHWFTRERRDKRFDAMVQKSIDNGQPLDPDTITRLTAKYSDSLLQLRGETIARTEALQSLNQSADMAFRQAIDEGLLSPNAIVREWDSAGDARVRHSHRRMDGQQVGLDEPFVTPSGGRLMFPGDYSLGADASEIINCRCVVKIKADFLAEAVDGPPIKAPVPVVPKIPLRPITPVHPFAPPKPFVPPAPIVPEIPLRSVTPVNPFVPASAFDPNAEREIGSVPRHVIEESHSKLPGYTSQYENTSLSSYVGSGYIQMNGYLRVKAKGVNSRGEPFRSDYDLDRKIRELEDLMKPSELSFAGYRGVRSEMVDEIKGLGVGDEFPMNGFTSVSRASSVSLQFARAGSSEPGILFKFILPKGTPMIATNPGEAELLLKSGHEFRILKIEDRDVPNPSSYGGGPAFVKIKVYTLEMLA